MKSIFVIIFVIASFIANIGSAATLSAEAQKVLYQNFEIQEYAEGAFFVSYKLPNTLFFNKKIEAPQYEEFRRAVVEHNVIRVVLNSPGGSIYEGLLIAGMIFDKKIDTYIPEGYKCYSACSFLFFAGKERHADGRLGVHQFSYGGDSGDKKEKIGTIANDSQLTIADIIQYLNEFDTPPKIFEWMLRTDPSDMYVLNKYNLQEIGNDDISEKFEDEIRKINSFLSKLQFAALDANCESKPASCTKDQLCSKSTTGVDPKSWKKSSEGKKFVDEAKKRSLQCDVPPPTCDESILACTDSEICADATSNNNGKIIWKTEENNLKFVKEAKKRNLQCNVSPPTCDEQMLICNESELCSRATSLLNGKTTWISEGNDIFVREAKRRGFKCNVNDFSSCFFYPSSCSTERLCKLSTTYSSGKAHWDTKTTFKKFVDEAKKRGLRCDTNLESNQKEIVKKPTPKIDTVTKNLVKQVQKKLNELGCNAGSVDGIIGSKTKRAIKQAAEINNLQEYSLNRLDERAYLEKYFVRKVESFTNRCSSISKSGSGDRFSGYWDFSIYCNSGPNFSGKIRFWEKRLNGSAVRYRANVIDPSGKRDVYGKTMDQRLFGLLDVYNSVLLKLTFNYWRFAVDLGIEGEFYLLNNKYAGELDRNCSIELSR